MAISRDGLIVTIWKSVVNTVSTVSYSKQETRMPKKTKTRSEKIIQKEVRRRLEAERTKRLYEQSEQRLDEMPLVERVQLEAQEMDKHAQWLEENKFSNRAVIDAPDGTTYIGLLFDSKHWELTPGPALKLIYKYRKVNLPTQDMRFDVVETKE